MDDMVLVNSLKIGDWVCFKYDVEQSAEILDIKRTAYGKEFVVRAYDGGYVNSIDGTTISVAARDCWVE